eukprot:m.302806 g.302806  ORF g.302806 m.302806 type:complete len:233 (-) comp19582_c1_seq3:772-1470(-)
MTFYVATTTITDTHVTKRFGRDFVITTTKVVVTTTIVTVIYAAPTTLALTPPSPTAGAAASKHHAPNTTTSTSNQPDHRRAHCPAVNSAQATAIATPAPPTTTPPRLQLHRQLHRQQAPPSSTQAITLDPTTTPSTLDCSHDAPPTTAITRPTAATLITDRRAPRRKQRQPSDVLGRVLWANRSWPSSASTSRFKRSGEEGTVQRQAVGDRRHGLCVPAGDGKWREESCVFR